MMSGALLHIATYSRLLKTSILDVLDQDYILTARSKGLSEPKIVWSHIMRNSFIPIVTRLPVSMATCITGSFIIEKIFSIPGIAAYYIERYRPTIFPLYWEKRSLSQHCLLWWYS